MGFLSGLLNPFGGGGGTSVGGDVGGIGNSRSAQQTENNNHTTNNDNRSAVTGADGLTAADGGTITYTSTATADKAFDIVDAVIGKTFANQNAQSNALAAAYSEAQGRGPLTDYIVLAGLAAAVAVAYFALKKG